MAQYPYLLPRRPAHLRCPGTTRVSQVPGITIHASHALCGPRQTLRALTLSSALFVLASGPLTPSPSGLWDFRPTLYRGCIKSWGIAVSLAGYVVPCVRLNRFVRLCSLLLNYLPNSCNTRYGWVVSPYPAGTFTLQETPSSLGALTAGAELPPGLRRTQQSPRRYTTKTANKRTVD